MTELCRVEFDDYVVRETGYASGGRMAPHAHEFSNITAVVNGEMHETIDAAEHRGRSCSVLLKPAGTMHSNLWLGRRGTRTVSIEFRSRSIARWQWVEDPDTARAALELLASLRTTSRDAVETASQSLIAAATAAASLGTGELPAWVAEVRMLLEARFDEPLRFESIAAELGLHPVYLSRAFRRYTGVAMSDYVRSLRLKHARHLLSATDLGIAAVSLDSGFADASHLCRVFATAHALTPKSFRRITQV
jgi:AraC family transcriptional regulator